MKRRFVGPAITAALGVGAYALSLLRGGQLDVSEVGLTLLLLGAGHWRLDCMRTPLEQIREQARQDGYDEGYIDGRRVARPVIVPLRGAR